MAYSPLQPTASRNAFTRFLVSLTRTKKIESKPEDALVTQLRRCLSTFDITLLGIATTLGSGVYVLTGEISHHTGPSIIISISLAAFASVLCGLCYTEFAARVPKAGSAYVYSYAVVGELCAFIVGWNLILEYGIGTAAVVKGLTQYADALAGGKLTEFNSLLGKISMFGEEVMFDLFSCILCLLLTGSVGIGVRVSSYLNSFCTVVNVIVISMFIVMGAFFVEPDRLRDFMPSGPNSIITAASSCFFAFIGFDAVCMVAEEAKNPNKSIPFAVVATIMICYFGFVGVALVLNMMISYKDMKGSSALATAFKHVDLPFGQYTIGVGAICGLLGNAITAMMMMPRFLYSMANDGIIFGFLGIVDSRFEIPLFATIFSGILIGGLSLILSLHMLVEMVSIGTILAYTLVTLSILILRYKAENLGMSRARSRSILSGISFSYDGKILVNPKLLKEELEDEIKQTQSEEETASGRVREDLIHKILVSPHDIHQHFPTKKKTKLRKSLSYSNDSDDVEDIDGIEDDAHTPKKAHTIDNASLSYHVKETNEPHRHTEQHHNDGDVIKQRQDDRQNDGDDNQSVIIHDENDATFTDNNITNIQRQIDDDILSDIDPREFSLLSSFYCGSNRFNFPTEKTQSVASICCLLIFIEVCLLAAILQFAIQYIVKANILVLIILVLVVFMLLITTLVLSSLPQNSQRLFFKVPCLPWLPVLGLFLNVYLMFGLNTATWIRFGVWMGLGFLIYFGYGFRHSRQRQNVQSNSTHTDVDT